MASELFTQVPRTLGNLLSDIKNGRLGLPTLQRDYVWKARKVRDLLDSMMKGYPIGYLMIWAATDDTDDSRTIGTDNKDFSAPKDLIIDGQQRLTSLYSAIYGEEISDRKFNKRTVVISFDPLHRIFEVADNATKRGYDWLYDISDVFKNSSKSFTYINETVVTIEEGRQKAGRELTEDDKQTIQQNIMDLLGLLDYSIPTMQINRDADEDAVADIFVRVNSGGENLGEDDFIMTLISQYWYEGRQKIQDFCRSAKVPAEKTAYNHIFQPSPTHIIRIAMCYGFRRARLHYAYMLLRGRNFDEGKRSENDSKYSKSLREEQFDKLKTVLDQLMNLQVWKEYIKCVETAGFTTKNLISSENSLVYTYAMYLIGKYDYGMSNSELRKTFSRWFFMTALTGYYTGSPESDVEADLADLRNIKTKEEYMSLLDNKIKDKLTDDYFNITLPNNLASSASRSPSWFAYCAALNILDAKVLFSNLHTTTLFDPSASGTKNALEKHHLFPKAYLSRIGITSDRDRNQIANFAFIEWSDNIEILDDSPAVYMKGQLAKIPPEEKDEIYSLHALPDGWEEMDYFDFLNRRRQLMAKVIKRGFERL